MDSGWQQWEPRTPCPSSPGVWRSARVAAGVSRASREVDWAPRAGSAHSVPWPPGWSGYGQGDDILGPLQGPWECRQRGGSRNYGHQWCRQGEGGIHRKGMEREVRTEVPSSSEPRAVMLGLLPVDCSDPQARLPRPRPGHEDLHAEAAGMGRRGGQAGRAGGDSASAGPSSAAPAESFSLRPASRFRSHWRVWKLPALSPGT